MLVHSLWSDGYATEIIMKAPLAHERLRHESLRRESASRRVRSGSLIKAMRQRRFYILINGLDFCGKAAKISRLP